MKLVDEANQYAGVMHEPLAAAIKRQRLPPQNLDRQRQAERWDHLTHVLPEHAVNSRARLQELETKHHAYAQADEGAYDLGAM